MREFVRAWGLFRDAMAPYFASFGISAAHWGVLRSLHRAEAERATPIRLTDLGRRLLVRPPSITAIVARLERAGFVARRRSSDDQRAKEVRLTARGRKLVDEVLRHHAEQTRTVLGGLDDDETREFLELVTRMNAHLEGLRRTRVRGEESNGWTRSESHRT